ncbi:MAG: PAS domain S-box protein [Alphaproteobacteria bacterium]|nr:PAS domain S-box protein [Alphaproteobacteria bacterium]
MNIDRVVQVVTDAATELTGAAYGSFFYNVTDERGESYMLFALSGAPREAFEKFPMPRNTKVFAPTFAGEGVVRSDDITKDSRYGKSAPHYGQPKGHLPVKSYLAVPVMSRTGEVLGGLFFGHPQPGRFNAYHEDVVLGIAGQAAITMDNARLYREANIEIERRKQIEAVLRSSGEVLRNTNEQNLAQLRDTERNFRLLVQSVTDYAIYMLDPSGIVASWNAGAERIKGYGRDEIVGRHYENFFSPADREAGIPHNALRVAAEKGRYESEGWRIRKDGSRFWALAVIDAVRDEQGRLIGFAKITRDMTERREAQLSLERAREQLAQAQKMEAIGQLTGGIAHDFNNMLMIVSGQAQLMRMRAENPKDLRALDAIDAAAKSGANLTRQLLTFARRQRLNPVVVDLASRLNAFRDLLTSSVGGAVKLEINVAQDAWPVEVDVGELELALVNIAVNARDAMPNGGTLRIVARNTTLSSSSPAALNGEFVVLSITDTGTGIPPELLAKVFEPFFTTKEVGKGTGLGLSQVYGFARQAGGDVTVASEQHRGTTVSLYLPRSHGTVVAEPERTPSVEPIQDAGTVLIVEDNAQVAEVSTKLFEQLGYSVVIAERPSEAIKRLEASQGISLVFSDIVMPGDIDGLALARCIRDKRPTLPILLATGYSAAAERAGAQFPILRKPYDLNTLAEAVRSVVSAKPRA